ncbi:merozoite surface protein 7 [Anopheles sinensis]|uniref:Merozoite surface protein 7 n=1 Tax=Anopheles sinensis TaxID=74873 RepID=A0A084WGL9_ANOSI|nr:merozoite surface protein 7 [Anopheles sinensis]
MAARQQITAARNGLVAIDALRDTSAQGQSRPAPGKTSNTIGQTSSTAPPAHGIIWAHTCTEERRSSPSSSSSRVVPKLV